MRRWCYSIEMWNQKLTKNSTVNSHELCRNLLNRENRRRKPSMSNLPPFAVECNPISAMPRSIRNAFNLLFFHVVVNRYSLIRSLPIEDESCRRSE